RNGHIKIFSKSFYYRLFDDINIGEDLLNKRIESLRKHEKMLYDSKMMIVKFFLDVDQKEQKDRIKELEESNRKSFYISKEDKKENENYEAYKDHFEKVLNATNFETSP